MLSTRRTASSWVRELSEARPESLHRLGHAVRVYHRSALAPYWSSLRGAVRADQRHRLERMSTGGVGAVLAELHRRGDQSGRPSVGRTRQRGGWPTYCVST
jgi:hypothetical protein